MLRPPRKRERKKEKTQVRETFLSSLWLSQQTLNSPPSPGHPGARQPGGVVGSDTAPHARGGEFVFGFWFIFSSRSRSGAWLAAIAPILFFLFLHLHPARSPSSLYSSILILTAHTDPPILALQSAQADGVDDGCTKVHNGPSTITKRRSHGRAAAALLLLAGAAAVSWAVTTGALRLPVGDVISRAALKSEVAKQVSRILKGERRGRKREERELN